MKLAFDANKVYLSPEVILPKYSKIYNMPVYSMKVKVLDITSTYVNYKYVNSNSKARAYKEAFLNDYKRGVLDVVNPDALEE